MNAQRGGVYERALAELQAGAKQSHWMWFVFPQIAGLGFSPMAQRFAISSRKEAVAYLDSLANAKLFQFRINGQGDSVERCVTARQLRDLHEFLDAAATY